MLRFILILIGLATTVFTLGVFIRYGLKLAGVWDERICNKRNSTFCGFNWYFRIPWAIGVVFEFFFFLILGSANYFKTNWWAIKASAYVSFLLFLAMVTSRGTVEAYYSWSMVAENGIGAMFSGNSTVWYLHMINSLYLIIGILITIESIRMHGWLAPVRMLLYGLSCVFISIITIMVLALLIALSLLYVAYRIIKFFMSSRRRRRNNDDDDESTPVILNNSYRRFRAELYEWEAERKNILPERRKKKEPEVKRKRPKIKRKPRPKPKDDDIPRFHPD